MQTKKHFSAPAVAVFVLLWLAWSIWQNFVLPKVHLALPGLILLDSVLVKGLLWAVLPLVLLRRFRSADVPMKSLFRAPFPWLPCLVVLCLSAAFLHTLRMVNGLTQTHAIFDVWMLVLSVTAGVYEEIGFRGFLFNVQDAALGFWPAALLNGVLFTLFHYPALIIADFAGLLSLRSLLIFTMGVLFCWMFRRWKSLPMLMVVHTAWDLISYLFCLT